MALVRKLGIDSHQYVDILTSTLFGAPVYKTYGKLIADGKFEPAGFAATLGEKDIRLTLAAGESLRVPLPIASLVRDRFLTLLANGGDTDSTGQQSAAYRRATPAYRRNSLLRSEKRPNAVAFAARWALNRTRSERYGHPAGVLLPCISCNLRRRMEGGIPWSPSDC